SARSQGEVNGWNDLPDLLRATGGTRDRDATQEHQSAYDRTPHKGTWRVSEAPGARDRPGPSGNERVSLRSVVDTSAQSAQPGAQDVLVARRRCANVVLSSVDQQSARGRNNAQAIGHGDCDLSTRRA